MCQQCIQEEDCATDFQLYLQLLEAEDEPAEEATWLGWTLLAVLVSLPALVGALTLIGD